MRIISSIMRKFILNTYILIGLSACAQRTEKVFMSKPDTLQNYYKVLLPQVPGKGLLVILGGFCTDPDKVMRETKLPEIAQKAGYTVVLPYLIDDCNVIDKD